jgi:hypothetical protein
MQLVTFKTARCKLKFLCVSSISVGPAALSFNRTLSVTCLFVFLALQPIVVVFSQPGSGL